MKMEQKTLLITGANRGLGQALVNEALERGAKRVYAGTRGSLQHREPRVTPLTLDVTNVSQIRQAVDQVDALDLVMSENPIDVPASQIWTRGPCKRNSRSAPPAECL